MNIENLKQLVEIIIELTKQRDSIKSQIIELVKQTNFFNNIVSIFGIGYLFASVQYILLSKEKADK